MKAGGDRDPPGPRPKYVQAMSDGQKQFPSFSFKFGAKPTEINALVQPTAPERPKHSGQTAGPTETRPKLFAVDKRGDFDIFRYDCKLNPLQVPVVRFQTQTPVGFSEKWVISIEPSGQFAVHKRGEDVKRVGERYFALPSSRFAPEEFIITDRQEGDVVLSDFIEFSSEQVDESPRTYQPPLLQAVQKRLQHEKLIASDPENPQHWISFIAAQEDILGSERLSRRAILERKIAICEAALKRLGPPQRADLLELYIQLQGELVPVEECLKLWELISSADRYNWDLRLCHIDFYCHQCSSIFTVEGALQLFTSLARDISGHSLNPRIPTSLVQTVLSRLLGVLSHSGRVGHCMGMLYLLLGAKGDDPDANSTAWNIRKAKLRSLMTTKLKNHLSSKSTALSNIDLEESIFDLLALIVDDNEDLDFFQVATYDFVTSLADKLGPDEILALILDFFSGANIVRNNGRTRLCSLWNIEMTMDSKRFRISPTLTDAVSKIWLIPHYFVQTVLSDAYRRGGPLRASALSLQAQLEQIVNSQGPSLLQAHLANEPTDWKGWHSYICLLLSMGRHAEAEKVLVKILLSSHLIPSDDDIFELSLLLCICSLDTGGQQTALQVILKAVLKTPTSEGPSSLLRFKKIMVDHPSANAKSLLCFVDFLRRHSGLDDSPIPTEVHSSILSLWDFYLTPKPADPLANALSKLESSLCASLGGANAHSLVYDFVSNYPYAAGMKRHLCMIALTNEQSLDCALEISIKLYSQARISMEELEMIVLFLEEKGCLLSEHLLYRLSSKAQ